jgi:hypothetical protein
MLSFATNKTERKTHDTFFTRLNMWKKQARKSTVLMSMSSLR